VFAVQLDFHVSCCGVFSVSIYVIVFFALGSFRRLAAFCSVVLSNILTTIGHIGIEVATSMSAPGTEETKRIALEWAHEYLSHTISYLALADL
jgi:hypothetical protein